jgi:hypothetical protein
MAKNELERSKWVTAIEYSMTTAKEMNSGDIVIFELMICLENKEEHRPDYKVLRFHKQSEKKTRTSAHKNRRRHKTLLVNV